MMLFSKCKTQSIPKNLHLNDSFNNIVLAQQALLLVHKQNATMYNTQMIFSKFFMISHVYLMIVWRPSPPYREPSPPYREPSPPSLPIPTQ